VRSVVRLLIALAVVTACAGDDPSTDDGSAAVTTAPPTTTTTTGTATTTTTTAATTTTGAPSTGPSVTESPSTESPATDPPKAETTGPTVISGSLDFRNYDLVVPSSYDGSATVPLVMSLHGYTGSAANQEAYFQLAPLAEERGFLLALPDGTYDALGSRFWNATDACCNFTGSDVDDVGHLLGIVDEISAAYRIDPDSIHLVGHSNGGFMSYRMACEQAEVFASVVSLAGATFADETDCHPSEPVRIVQIHGTADPVIRYEGAEIPVSGPYPGALETAMQWAAANGCDGGTTPGDAAFDLDAGIDGPDTTVTIFTGCPDTGTVELWTIEGGGHVPPLTDEFRRRVVDAMLAGR